MIVFLLKSSACLAGFLMFYKLLLEKERMHTFKRYYLLAALILAFAFPSITFVEYIEVPSAPTPTYIESAATLSTETVKSINGETPEPVLQNPWAEYWPIIFWTIYGLGVLLFAFKFLFHMGKIIRNIRNHSKIRIDHIVHVLLKDSLVPHTFFNYIFLNRQKFEADEIPKEVLLHEAAHVRQKHSLDVVLIELLQMVFWFNPLIHIIKKSVKLNHEFLADEAVLEQGASTSDYQNTLLSFASSAEYEKYQPSMANAINYSSYSSIKKRFKVMKTRTSKKSILVKTILILPMLAVMLYGFSTRVQIPKEPASAPVLQEGATKMQLSEFNALAKKYNAQPQEKRIIPSGDLRKLEDIYGKMTPEQKADAQAFPECPDPKLSNQEGATKKQVGEYNRLAKKYNEMLAAKGNIRIKKSEVDRLEYLHGIMTEEQRAEAEPFPDFPEPPEAPRPPAPPSEIEIEQQKNQMKKQSEEMGQQAAVMHEQAKKIEQQAMRAQKQALEIEEKREVIDKKAREMEVEEQVMQEIIENQEIIAEETVTIPPKPFLPKPSTWHIALQDEPGIYLTGKEITYQQMKQMEKNGEITSMNVIKTADGNHIIELNQTNLQPPAPSAPRPLKKPKSLLELLKELKNENVKIILNGKEIGYEEAEKQFEESTFIRVDVSKEEGKRPVLEVSSH